MSDNPLRHILTPNFMPPALTPVRTAERISNVLPANFRNVMRAASDKQACDARRIVAFQMRVLGFVDVPVDGMNTLAFRKALNEAVWSISDDAPEGWHNIAIGCPRQRPGYFVVVDDGYRRNFGLNPGKPW